ncbi:MAG: adenine deaminase C-terminal domain-containing protein [Caryophanon sp.]|nr:adenine deaminase C-terminal domain-containing protein [Caryophanon sp.]
MFEPIWKMNDIRNQVAVIDGLRAPTIVLQNARYLHSVFRDWRHGNIWIAGDRIVYVGDELPQNITNTEMIDMTGKTVVPGYIEPHVHPHQLYNPVSFARYGMKTGTSTMLCDNLAMFLALENKKAFSMMDRWKSLPTQFYWWVRFDSQTQLEHEHEVFSMENVLEWIERPDVLMGGEVTGWPRLMAGDDEMLYWIQAAKLKGKKIEAHLPGASEKTLAKMRLFGANGDHEAMTVDDVEKRINQGYAVTLRYSSIRPDLPNILKDIVEKGWNIFHHLMMTTDGSTPMFHEDGVMDKCIRAALAAGVDPIDAYNMASYNVAKYYGVSNLHGMISTGRFATLNVLTDEFTPVPEAVMAKGQWMVRDGEEVFDWPEERFEEFTPLALDFELHESDFQFSIPFGIKLVNDVITKPYSVNLHLNKQAVVQNEDECYLMLIDKFGKWHVNTFLKGFAKNVQGFASTYSTTGDVILIGKSIEAMMQAFSEVKKLGGGIVLIEDEQVIASIPLTVGGLMSDLPMEQLIEQEKALIVELRARGFDKGDAIYSLLFLQSTHLPYIRITPKGLYDVMKKNILLPAMMRE